MKRYDENFKIEALRLSDDIGVKKACEQLNVTTESLFSAAKIARLKNTASLPFGKLAYLHMRFPRTNATASKASSLVALFSFAR